MPLARQFRCPAKQARTYNTDAGRGTVIEPRLYQLIRQTKPIAERQFEIAFFDPGVEAFDFTFG